MLKFKLNVAERKTLAKRMEELTGIHPYYTKAPLYSYAIGSYTLDRNGHLLDVYKRQDVEVSDFRHIIESMMVLAACEYGLDGDFTKLVNPTGRFVLGGSYADCGVTGRKLACDTYGGIGRMGGGALSGKDPTKVDRSAAYMARKIAKDIVQAGYADLSLIHI